MRIIAFVTEGESVRRILAHVGEPATPSALMSSRAPPQVELAYDQDQGDADDFDQRPEHADEAW